MLGIKDWKKDKCVWSPERPNLFAIEMQLEIKGAKGKAPEYTFPVVKTFGFRKFDCLKGDYYINDSIVKLMGVSYNQQWSEGGLWTDQNPVQRHPQLRRTAQHRSARYLRRNRPPGVPGISHPHDEVHRPGSRNR